MTTSPSLLQHSDGHGRWKRKRRTTDPIFGRKNKRDGNYEEDDDKNDDELDNSEGPPATIHNPNLPEVLAEGSNICVSGYPHVVRYQVTRPHAMINAVIAIEKANANGENRGRSGRSGLLLENVSYGQLQVVSAMPRSGSAAANGTEVVNGDGGGGGGGGVPCVITPLEITKGKGVAKQFGNGILVVPMHSDWFNPETVNRLQRQGVPQLFSEKSSTQKYMECRNYIIAKYMENPEKELIVSNCQGLTNAISSEDLNQLVRFLDNWGIINYLAIDPPCQKKSNESYSCLREDQDNVVHVSSDGLKSIDCLIKFDKPKCRLKAADTDLENKIEEKLSENSYNCCSRPIPLVYYQSQKEVDVLICCDCFHDGKFLPDHSSIDFLKMDTSKDYVDQDGENWSDQETLLLLEALEKYHENWTVVAEHVGSKSKAQCVAHFLHLPVEDNLLDNIEMSRLFKPTGLANTDAYWGVDSNSDRNVILGSHLQDTESENSLPFANSGNPIMSLVTFLTSTVGPRVSAACSHACLAVLSQELDGSAHSNRINVDNMDGKEQILAARGSEASIISDEIIKAALKSGLATAATKAKFFADHEEREIQRLSANTINHQLKRLELKLKYFAEVETLLMKECEQADRERQKLASDRTRLEASRLGHTGAASQMNPPGVMVNNNFINNRQNVISASTSQLSISGHGLTNQTAQPQMRPYMQRQPVFQSGPSHPIRSMHASSSANVMFNTFGNSQSGLNHPMLRSLSGSSSGLG
ncbi:hypothetical protein ACFE04_025720 [Oxalis oulophora]